MEKFISRLLRFGCTAALALGIALPAEAYFLEGPSWHTPTIPMRVQMGASSLVLADGSVDFNSVVENAMKLWNQQIAATQFTWTVASPGTAASEGDGVNSMQLSSTVYGDDFGANVLAITLYMSSGGSMTEADVLFNTANKFNSYRGTTTTAGTAGYFDLHRVAVHELGHVLGLDHPDDHGQDVFAIMDAHISTADRLQSDDVAGVVSLYGAPDNPPPTTGASQVLQISTRGNVGTGDNVMIGGFIVQTSAPKKVIIRAIGPSLGLQGVSGALADPVLELHDGTGAIIQTNDNWKDTQEQEIEDSTVAPTDDREAAIVAELADGSYTAIVRGVNNTTGVALVEVYDLDPDNGKIANISTRARVDSGDNALIGGFIIRDPQSQPVVVRALGPSLGSQGVTGTLVNPVLDLYNANGDLIVSNDNYPTAINVGTIGSYNLYPASSLESAAYFEGAPGNYTAVVRGGAGFGTTSGVALVEVYGVN